ncbi:MAG TPA: carboxypeptidase regulatory-like domain-containing protein [Chitinophagales bacterium]|nr:carboxypeptidase regulatory-like domain-containing protein [Chitinophagales bacterium]HMU71047.1 carboxypeptidase regulatory-like domain-containing protein [Chitinophagales bacterium]HMZ90280.1 carboxypeptidase regulatory-like domain-containing protein [Chitinophagales bacterium]HNA57841.1 carboxypeptidase regulatory-like domain-containing protein [Chitinophagales bacterium]HNE46772.1 carboxypeptidase regulatory-like domain-containing protein [Chitinophagales bacterium]
MKRLLIICLGILSAFPMMAQNEGEINGKVIDGETGNSVPYAHCILLSSGAKVMEVEADDAGLFYFKPLKPGTYDLNVLFVGYDTAKLESIELASKGMVVLNVEMSVGTILPPVYVGAPLVDKQVPEVVKTYKAKDIGHMAVDDAQDIIRLAPAVYEDEKTGGMSIGGSREDATLYVVDGVKVIGPLYVPINSIAEVRIITGGIPANYGDVTGGVVEITTKGYSGVY